MDSTENLRSFEKFPTPPYTRINFPTNKNFTRRKTLRSTWSQTDPRGISGSFFISPSSYLPIDLRRGDFFRPAKLQVASFEGFRASNGRRVIHLFPWRKKTCCMGRDKPETQECMWDFNALNSTKNPPVAARAEITGYSRTGYSRTGSIRRPRTSSPGMGEGGFW